MGCLTFLPAHMALSTAEPVNDPPMLLADEPTANLDSASGYQVIRILEDIAARTDKTAVVVTHDHRITDAADRLLWLEDGRPHERKPSSEIEADPVWRYSWSARPAAAPFSFLDRPSRT